MAKVLIVEDNRANMKLMSQVAMTKGHVVLEAMDADRGIELANAELPDVIVMDVQLPGKDGLTAVRELRAEPSTMAIPIMVVTARGMLSERDKIEASGCDAYLLKPIDYHVFLDTIEKLCRGSSS